MLGSPGADDNASAVAALMELSRVLASTTRARTLRIVAFVNEEPPFFYWGKMGSQVYARAMRERGENVRLMLSLEMLGYYRDEPDTQNYPPCFAGFTPAVGISLASSRTCARDLPCNGLPKRFVRSPIFRCRPFRLSGLFPEFHGATIDRSGATAIPP